MARAWKPEEVTAIASSVAGLAAKGISMYWQATSPRRTARLMNKLGEQQYRLELASQIQLHRSLSGVFPDLRKIMREVNQLPIMEVLERVASYRQNPPWAH